MIIFTVHAIRRAKAINATIYCHSVQLSQRANIRPSNSKQAHRRYVSGVDIKHFTLLPELIQAVCPGRYG